MCVFPDGRKTIGFSVSDRLMVYVFTSGRFRHDACGGVREKGDIRGNVALKEAYELGLSIK